ncbi:helix-turn-helix domain-containing protein [Acidovorax citrulli]|nr:helix-turn-helix domain-containing protein [Paracidovorax citrulli]
MQWNTVIAEIQARRGWTQPQVARAAGCAQATISDLATGKTTEPRFALGQALLKLHRASMRKAPLPKEQVRAEPAGQGAPIASPDGGEPWLSPCHTSRGS